MRGPVILSAAVLAAGLVYSQTEKEPAFEVVSIKHIGDAHMAGPGQSMSFGMRLIGTRFTGNMQLFSLIQSAYDLKGYEIIAPDWIKYEVYQIDTVIPAGTKRDAANRMLRAVLKDRFGSTSPPARRWTNWPAISPS